MFRLLSGVNVFLSLCAYFIGSTAADAANDEWRISPESAACFLEHLDDYRNAGGDPVVIVVSACPETDRVKALATLQRNSAPGLRESAVADSGFDNVVVLTLQELDCIAKLDGLDPAQGIVLRRPIGCEQ